MSDLPPKQSKIGKRSASARSAMAIIKQEKKFTTIREAGNVGYIHK